jgi:hypothetical protein
MTRAQCAAKGHAAARNAQAAQHPGDDGIYRLLRDADDAEITRWASVDPKIRWALALPAAATFVERHRLRDRQAVEIVLSKFTDWGALLMVLAECADLERVAEVTGVRAARRSEAA